MDFELPQPVGYTIYSKYNCPNCNKVKELLKDVKPKPTIIQCDEYLLECKEEFLSFIQSINGGIEYRTFPMVFFQGKFIGGFLETQKWYDKEAAFSSIL
jgi:glutaredoxin